MRFFRQEYWNGLPFPSPEDFPNPGIEPGCPALGGGFFTPKPPDTLKEQILGRCSWKYPPTQHTHPGAPPSCQERVDDKPYICAFEALTMGIEQVLIQ